jgi:phospholipid/cholesterol/gamma-HCH transport system substrate-binding protein
MAMRIKFNLYERVAGLFVLIALVGCVAATAGVAVKQGWFESKTLVSTDLKNAEGIHEGSTVQMAGLHIGKVTNIELKSDNEIRVQFEVRERFINRLRTDSFVRVVRPFIIGEKVLDVSVGSDSAQVLADGALLKSEPSVDLMDMMSGRTLGPYLETMSKMVESLKTVAEAILDPQRTKVIVKIFDELHPLVQNMSAMAGGVNGLLKQVNGKKQLTQVVNNLVAITDEVNLALPAIKKDSPQMAADVAKIARNMAVLTDEMQKALPALQELGPELPRVSKRAIEALDETVVTLKALQKSFLLRGSVRDVKTEEAERDLKVKNRLPSGEVSPLKGSQNEH